jgi:hypothetical protein
VGRFPRGGDFGGGETVGFVHQVAELAFELQGFGGLPAGGFDGAGVFVAANSGEQIRAINCANIRLSIIV